MDTSFINKKINLANVSTLLKTAIAGILISEVLFLSREVSVYVDLYVLKNHYEYWCLGIIILYSFFLIAYLLVREFTKGCVKIYKSYRLDIAILLLLGFFTSFSGGGLGTKYYHGVIEKIDPITLIFISFLPFILVIGLAIRAVQIKIYKRQNNEPFFISDIEGKTKDKDLLDHANSAIRFAERVFNGGSSDSMVFGIDAPWGIGKSTFVNYCIESWDEEKYKDKVILYKFNPLRYEDRANLLEKFIDGLVVTLQKNHFVPEIRTLVSKYSRLIKTKKTFSLFGFDIDLSSGDYTVDDAFDDLELALLDFDKKVIVIVDDLDRLSFSAIKDVLFTIKKSFTLPNISYVLCYDTENIVALEKKDGDAEKIREFLEKFINVKISLFLDEQILSKYVTENFETAMLANLQADPYTRDKLRETVDVLVELYKSADFHQYQLFLGDIRKIKRLLNTLMLFEIEQTDFDNSDIDKYDLIHLVLIYINYPNLFRKIYNTETGGKRGFFSAVIPYDDGYPNKDRIRGERDNRYENSTYYTEFIANLPEGQKFLLGKIFDVSKRLPSDRQIDSATETMRKTYACFNGDGLWTGGKNLQEYLYLIVKLSKPQKRDQYKYYLNLIGKVKNGLPVEEVLLKEESFSFSNNENSHEQFWRIIVNTAFELSPDTGTSLISYLLNHMTDYSYYSNKDIGVGLRDGLDFFLVKLLDNAGWSDPEGTHAGNTEENLTEISEWIFGEGRHIDSGVLDTLSKKDRGVLGLFDLMSFRLFCSADRGGNIFNLQRALLRHADTNKPADINNVVEEMREISQKVFSIFKSQYILKQNNVFEVIDNLTLADISGKYFDFIENQIVTEKISRESVEKEVDSFKSRMKGFILFQLGNEMVDHGVGCGLYDETGSEDEGGIRTLINNYLFDYCFNSEIVTNGYEYFLDYLLISFAGVFSTRKGHKYTPSIDEFTKVLDRGRLLTYWKTNLKKIKELNLDKKEKEVTRGEYTASYKDDIKNVFETLDTFLQNEESKTVEDLPKNSDGEKE